jgi:hypothetical protein
MRAYRIDSKKPIGLAGRRWQRSTALWPDEL